MSSHVYVVPEKFLDLSKIESFSTGKVIPKLFPVGEEYWSTANVSSFEYRPDNCDSLSLKLIEKLQGRKIEIKKNSRYNHYPVWHCAHRKDGTFVFHFHKNARDNGIVTLSSKLEVENIYVSGDIEEPVLWCLFISFLYNSFK